MNYRKLARELLAIAAELWPRVVSKRTVELATADGEPYANMLRAIANAMLEAGLDRARLVSATSSATTVTVQPPMPNPTQEMDTRRLLALADDHLRNGSAEKWFIEWYAGFMSRLAVGVATSRDWNILWLTVNR